MKNNGIQGKIVIIDGDENILRLLRYNLVAEGFDVLCINDSAKVSSATVLDTRLIIIDAMEQTPTGLDIITSLRENDSLPHIPVIICTNSTDETFAVKALDCGADDFLTKPFSLRELLARVNALLRRYPMSIPVDLPPRVADEIVIRSFDLHIDTFNRRVVKGADLVPLTKTEFAILEFLIRNKDNYFTRDQIFSEVWNENAKANPRIVDTNISRMRKKLGEASKIIVNRYGLGYSFNAEI